MQMSSSSSCDCFENVISTSHEQKTSRDTYWVSIWMVSATFGAWCYHDSCLHL